MIWAAAAWGLYFSTEVILAFIMAGIAGANENADDVADKASRRDFWYVCCLVDDRELNRCVALLFAMTIASLVGGSTSPDGGIGA
jgi:hypothetical protein